MDTGEGGKYSHTSSIGAERVLFWLMICMILFKLKLLLPYSSCSIVVQRQGELLRPLTKKNQNYEKELALLKRKFLKLLKLPRINVSL